MDELIDFIKNTPTENQPLPFSVYASKQEQKILNVPIVNPLLVVVLDGEKRLGQSSDIVCSTGNFVFLSNSPNIDMRNIPSEKEYCALLIGFEHRDFEDIRAKTKANTKSAETYFTGDLNPHLEKTLLQFLEWSLFSPPELWPMRRREILHYFNHLGYHSVGALSEASSVSQRLYDFVQRDMASDISLDVLCEKMAMSESTLRRKLLAEGTNFQEIKDRVKLGFGLHLLQTTKDSIGLIAEQCGYQSQSRFTDKFKQRFGLTPSELRKTLLTD